MPRKERIEYPGAIYHVISRGNYRKDLFTAETTGAAFEKTIFEAVVREKRGQTQNIKIWPHWEKKGVKRKI